MPTKYFIIAEKPELRKAVQAAIRQGYNRIPPGEYSVANSFGHLMKLKEPSMTPSTLPGAWRTCLSALIHGRRFLSLQDPAVQWEATLTL